MSDADRWRRIEPQPEYSPHIGALVQIMACARMTTLKAVEGMGVAELDATAPGFSNSVGMLLAHMAATDRIYQAASFENRDPFETPEYAPYQGAMTFGWKGESRAAPWQACSLSWQKSAPTHSRSCLSGMTTGWPRR